MHKIEIYNSCSEGEQSSDEEHSSGEERPVRSRSRSPISSKDIIIILDQTNLCRWY